MRSVQKSIRAYSAIVFAAVSSTSLEAQAKHAINAARPVDCRLCRVVLTKVATLGRIEDEELPGVSITSDVAVDSKGRFYSTSMDVQKVLVYDRSGRFLKAIGKKGSGPGEFTHATKLTIDAHDTLHVSDGFRISTFGPAGNYVRTVTVTDPNTNRFVTLPNGELALTSNPLTAGARTFRIVSPTGAVRHVGTPPVAPLACPSCYRMLGASGAAPDEVWTMSTNKYVIERWNVRGELVHQLAVDKSPWMVDWSSPAVKLDLTVPPHPSLTGVGEDADQRLWILGVIPASNWKPIPPDPNKPTGMGRLNIPAGGLPTTSAQHARMISVVEVIDLRTDRIVVSESFPGRILRMVKPGVFAKVYEDVNGIPVLDIFNAEIRRR